MSTRRINVGCEFVHVAGAPTPAVYNVEVLPDPRVSVLQEEWSVDPDAPSERFTDIYGNRPRTVVLPAGESLCRYSALVEVPDELEAGDPSAQQLPPEDVPGELLVYTLPSRFCPSDVMRRHAWKLFGNKTADYNRVQDIVDYANGHLTFQYGSSEASSSALDVYVNGYGVCRDFAHLAITFCRALNIPTRYVFGYLPDMDVPPDPAPMDFVASMEVYLDGGWFTFDPRNNARRKGRVPIAKGRDAADVAMATTFGAPWLKRMTVIADEAPAAVVQN
ncbi:transglutaminase family protein [Nigerium sp.]|uniref:transglutaminase-like domain-containing protein n=1 Tax=Nigerium sp. TaxID=2042655 RepID=UPI0032219702